MAYRIQITLPAKLDAKEYTTFIRDEQKSPNAASKWLIGLHAAIKALSEDPNSFSIIPEADELGFPYRSFVYHSHRVVYAVHETNQTVTVHRIFHGSRGT